MSDTSSYDPEERFNIEGEDPEDVLKRLLGVDPDDPEEGTDS